MAERMHVLDWERIHVPARTKPLLGSEMAGNSVFYELLAGSPRRQEKPIELLNQQLDGSFKAVFAVPQGVPELPGVEVEITKIHGGLYPESYRYESGSFLTRRDHLYGASAGAADRPAFFMEIGFVDPVSATFLLQWGLEVGRKGDARWKQTLIRRKC